jgi:hypothetical protein
MLPGRRIFLTVCLVGATTLGCAPSANQAGVMAVGSVATGSGGVPTGAQNPEGPATGGAQQPSGTGGGTPTAGSCLRESPVLEPDIGGAHLGAYAGQGLPSGFNRLDSEGAITAGIGRIEAEGTSWACFQRFYPAATATYTGLKPGGAQPLLQ